MRPLEMLTALRSPAVEASVLMRKVLAPAIAELNEMDAGITVDVTERKIAFQEVSGSPVRRLPRIRDFAITVDWERVQITPVKRVYRHRGWQTPPRSTKAPRGLRPRDIPPAEATNVVSINATILNRQQSVIKPPRRSFASFTDAGVQVPSKPAITPPKEPKS